jgi:hypothetical protein
MKEQQIYMHSGDVLFATLKQGTRTWIAAEVI